MDGDIKFGRIGWVAVGVGRGMAKGAVRGASHRRIGSSSETGVVVVAQTTSPQPPYLSAYRYIYLSIYLSLLPKPILSTCPSHSAPFLLFPPICK